METVGRLCTIAANQMGQEGFAESDFRRFAADDDSWLAVAVGDDLRIELLAERDLDADPPAHPIHGFAIAGVWERSRVSEEMYAPLSELEANTALGDADYPIGYFRDIVVRADSQGQGIGLALGTDVAPRISRHASGIIAPVWERPDHDSANMVAAFGGKPMYVFEDYDLYDSGANCPVCPDDGACGCTFVMYGDLEIGDVLVPPGDPEPVN